MKWVVLPCSESNSEETNCIEVKITHFPVIKYSIKRIAFENEYESNYIIYLPTFLLNLRLMHPLSFNTDIF